MRVDPDLINRIYEAGVDHRHWPELLQDIADRVGAYGSAIIIRSASAFSLLGSTKGQQIGDEFIAEGWWRDPYAEPLFREFHPGFRAETAYRTVEEIEASRIHREFWEPRGLIAGCATVLQGAKDDILQVTFEGFPSHDAAQLAIPFLDALRPHLARSVGLTAQLQAQRNQHTVDALALGGVAAAIVDRRGGLFAANDLFVGYDGNLLDISSRRLRFLNKFLQSQFAEAIAQVDDARQVRSIAPRVDGDTLPMVVHLLPLVGSAVAMSGSDGVLIMIADPANAIVPGANTLRLLFDLTPAEARLVGVLASGTSLTDAAAALNIAVSTARVHLRAIFSKTGTTRQAELVRLVSDLGPPVSDKNRP